jgi:hypothetical protein
MRARNVYLVSCVHRTGNSVEDDLTPWTPDLDVLDWADLDVLDEEDEEEQHELEAVFETRMKAKPPYNISENILDDPLKAMLVVMLRYVIPALIVFAFLSPNHLPMHSLEALRTSSQVSDIQLSMAMLLSFLIPLKVPEWCVNTRNAMINLIVNCMCHYQINISNNNIIKKENIAPRMMFFIALFVFVVNKSYCLRPSGYLSTFAAQNLFMTAHFSGEFDAGKEPSTMAVACFVIALGTVMLMDDKSAQWPNCHIQLCPLSVVPPSSLCLVY